MIFDSKTNPLKNRREQLLIDLLVLLTKNPRNNPKNKSNIICLGRSTKGMALKFNNGIKNINKNNPHLILYKDRI